MAQPIKKEVKTTPKTPVDLTYKRDKDREMVKGIFRFYEVPGGSMSFNYKAYKGDQVQRYDLVDGQVYSLPLGVAKHLNNNLWYPEYGFIPGEKDVATAFNSMTGTGMRITKKVKRCAFQSLEFMDLEDVSTNPSPVITVEQLGI
jgi:hypothetical protein